MAKSVELDGDGAAVRFTGGGTGVPACDRSRSTGTEACATQTPQQHTAHARWLIDASGRDTFLGRHLRLPKTELGIPKRIAVYAHFTGVFRNEGEAAGHITIVRLQDGWFWFIPLADGKTSVGMVRKLDDFHKAEETIEDWFTRTVAGSLELRQRMRGAERVSQFYTTSDYTYRYGMLAAPRALLVGDAGGFVDPIFSSGVFIACRTAQLASDLLMRADAEGRPLTAREQRDYTRTMQRIMNIYLDMILMYYDNHAFEIFTNPIDRFGFIQTVATILAGNTQRSFRLWWRRELFYLLCRFQRYLPIVPRLNFGGDAGPPCSPCTEPSPSVAREEAFR